MCVFDEVWFETSGGISGGTTQRVYIVISIFYFPNQIFQYTQHNTANMSERELSFFHCHEPICHYSLIAMNYITNSLRPPKSRIWVVIIIIHLGAKKLIIHSIPPKLFWLWLS